MATNVLEILLKVSGAGKASAEIKKLDGTLDKVGGTAGSTTGKFNQLKSGLTSTYTSFLKFAGVAAGVVGSMVGIGIAIKKLGDGFMDYAFQVKDAARLSGSSAEEMSKLIQVADDARVSVEGLTRGMWMLSQRGITPSIENLGKLADEYNTLAAGTERNTWLMEKFGRSGREMAKILELGSQKIKEMGDSIEGTGLLITSEGIKKAEDYYAALDQLGDSAKGATIILGGELAPAITGVAESLNDLVKWHMMSEESLKAFMDATEDGVITQEEYNKIIEAGYKGLEEYLRQMGLTDSITRDYTASTEKATGATNRLGDAIEEVTQGIPAANAATKDWRESLAGIAGISQEAAANIGRMASAFKRLEDVDLNIASKIEDAFRQINLGPLLGPVEDAMAGLADALRRGIVDPFTEGQQALKDLRVGLELLLLRAGEKTKWEAFEDLKNSAMFTKQELADIWKALNDIDGFKAQAYITTVITYKYGGATDIGEVERLLGKDLNGNGIIGRQYGGPVSAGTPYLVGERGPEMFIPNSAGRVINNQTTNQLIGGAKTTTIENEFNIYPPQIVDVRQLARLVTREQNRTAAR